MREWWTLWPWESFLSSSRRTFTPVRALHGWNWLVIHSFLDFMCLFQPLEIAKAGEDYSTSILLLLIFFLHHSNISSSFYIWVSFFPAHHLRTSKYVHLNRATWFYAIGCLTNVSSSPIRCPLSLCNRARPSIPHCIKGTLAQRLEG